MDLSLLLKKSDGSRSVGSVNWREMQLDYQAMRAKARIKILGRLDNTIHEEQALEIIGLVKMPDEDKMPAHLNRLVHLLGVDST